MQNFNTAEALAASIENEASYKITEARFLSCQTDCRRLEEKLRRAEGRAEELEAALREKTELNARLEEEANGAKRAVVDKEQALAVKERQLARLQEAQERDRNSSSAALQALQRDEDRFTALLAEKRDLSLQVASLTVDLSSEQDRLGTLQSRNEVLEKHSEELSSELSTLREELLGEKQELAAQLQIAQADLQHAGFSIESLADCEKKWQDRCKDLEAEKRELMNKMLKDSEFWAAKEGELKNEVERMTRARDMFKDAAVQRDEKIEMLQASCARLDVMAQEQKKVHEDAIRSAELLQSQTDAELENYKAMVESVDMGFIPRRIPNAAAVQGVSLDIEPLEDLSKPDLYMKYSEVFKACKRGKDELARKTEYIHYLTNEQRKAGDYIEELRKKFDQQSQICAQLRREVEELEKAPKEQENAIFKLESELSHTKKMLRVTEQCAEDQSQQIKHLLEENTRMSVGLYPRKALPSMKHRKPANASSAISQDLVTVDSINDMVEQNRELRVTLRLLTADCEEKEGSWMNGLEAEKERLARHYDQELKDLDEKLRASMEAADKLEKEKNAYFDMMMSGAKNPSNLSLALGPPAGSSTQETSDSAQSTIRRLEGELRETKRSAEQVPVLESILNQTKEDLTGSRQQVVLLQSTLETHRDNHRNAEVKYRALKNVLHSTKKALEVEREVSRCSKAETIRLEHSDQALQARVSDLNAKIDTLREENYNLTVAKEKVQSDLHREALERSSLAWKVQSLEAQHRAELAKVQREDAMESTIQGTLSKFGQQMSSVAAEAAKREALEGEKAELEARIEDYEANVAALNLQISALKSAAGQSEAIIAELRNTIKQQDQSGRTSAESTKNIFVLNQRLKAAQEEAARRKTIALEMEELSKEKEKKLVECEASLKEKDEALGQLRAENNVYKRKVVSLAKSMKGGTSEEKRQMEAEVAEAKAQAASALEEKERVEQLMKVANSRMEEVTSKMEEVTSKMENADKAVMKSEAALTKFQNSHKQLEEHIAGIQAELTQCQAEVQQAAAEKALLEGQLKELRDSQDGAGELQAQNDGLKVKIQQLENDLKEQTRIYEATSQSLKETEEELTKLKQISDDNTAKVPFDVQQELERLRIMETGHQQELAALKGELEALKMEARALSEKNLGLVNKLSIAQKTVAEVPELRARMDQVYSQYSESLEKATQLGGDNDRLRRALDLKEKIIDNLKQQLAQVPPTPQDESPVSKEAPMEATELPAKQPLHGANSGHLLELRQRAMQSMQVQGMHEFVSRGPAGEVAQVHDGLEPAPSTASPTKVGYEEPPDIFPAEGSNPTLTQASALDPPEHLVVQQQGVKRSREQDLDAFFNGSNEEDPSLDLIVQTEQKRIRVTPVDDIDDVVVQSYELGEPNEQQLLAEPGEEQQEAGEQQASDQQQEEQESLDYDESSSEDILEIIEPGKEDDDGDEEEAQSPGSNVMDVEEGEYKGDTPTTAGTSEEPVEDGEPKATGR